MSDNNSFDKTFEAALSGRTIADGSDDAVVELIETLRAERDLLGAPRGAEAHIAAAASAVPEMSAPAPRVARKRSGARRLRRRMVVLASSFAVLMATAGVGLADNAIPGEALYGLDLALENAGIGDGGPSERAAEVLELLSQGKTGLALGHAAEIAGSLPEAAEGAAAIAALEAVAERFVAEGSPVPDGVAQLIASLAESIGTGDGESIAEIARAIRDSVGQGDGHGRPDGVPVGPPASVPAPVTTPNN